MDAKEKFLEIARQNKLKFDKHLKLKQEVFGDMSHEDLNVIFKGGAIDDLFSLKLIEYVDKFNQSKFADEYCIKYKCGDCECFDECMHGLKINN